MIPLLKKRTNISTHTYTHTQPPLRQETRVRVEDETIITHDLVFTDFVVLREIVDESLTTE